MHGQLYMRGEGIIKLNKGYAYEDVISSFYDLFDNGREILACTSKGVYYSTREGSNWNARYTSSACGTFQQLSSDGRYLLATTSKGLYYSTSNGSNWNKR